MKNLLLLLPRYILFGWVIPNCQTILDVKKRKREVITACDCECLCVWLFFYLNSHSWSLSHGAENLASEISGQTSPYLVNSHFSIPTTSFEFEMQHGLFPVSPSLRPLDMNCIAALSWICSLKAFDLTCRTVPSLGLQPIGLPCWFWICQPP